MIPNEDNLDNGPESSNVTQNDQDRIFCQILG